MRQELRAGAAWRSVGRHTRNLALELSAHRAKIAEIVWVGRLRQRPLSAMLQPVTYDESCAVGDCALGSLVADAVCAWASDVESDSSEKGSGIHVLATSNGSPYLNWQTRVMYKTFKDVAKGSDMRHFTRLLHRRSDDELMAVAGEREESLVRYVFGCLDALGWRWGPCHVEVKLTPDRGPVLVEVNAGRPNGVDFRLICDACIGYNQYDVCADLYLTGGALFDELPTMPPPTLAAAGRLVKLVCAASGVLGGVNFEEAIGALPSLVRFEVEREEGDHIDATVDLASCAGYAHLVHPDADAVERDYRALRALQDEGLFEVSVDCR